MKDTKDETMEKKKSKKRKHSNEDDTNLNHTMKNKKNDPYVKENSSPKKKEENTLEPNTSKRKRKRKRKKKSNIDVTKIISSNATASEIIETRKQLSKLEVYIEGLPFECTEEEVKDFFIHGGCSDIHELRLPRWQDTGRLRGYGHVVFSSIESRDKAIQSLSGQYLKKRYITIAPSRQPNSTPINHNPKQPPKGCCTIFVKNLPYDISEQDMEQTFRTFGKLANDSGSVRLALNSTTRKPKGFGYVQFKNPEGAMAAVQKANDTSDKGGIVIKGRILFVDYEERGMKMSFRTTEGKLWSKEHGTSDKRFKKGPTL